MAFLKGSINYLRSGNSANVVKHFIPNQPSSPVKCADVLINPDNGLAGDVVSLSTTTVGAHIFYTRVKITATQPTGVDPTHTDDTPTGITVRIGSNTGSTTGPGGLSSDGVIRALAYKLGLLDSNITEGDYARTGGGGSGF